MNDVLGQFPEILRYGAVGISVIVCFFACLLLKQQIGKGSRNKTILQAIIIFIGFSVIILSLVDVGLREKMRSDVNFSRKQQAKINIMGTIPGDKKPGVPMPSSDIRVLPSVGDGFVVKTDSKGNFVFKGVPEKMRWKIAKRDIKPGGRPPEKWLFDPTKKEKSVPSSPL